jgi:Bacterial Ig-like domain (group 3)
MPSASYQGDSNFISSPSAALAQTVSAINSSVDPSAPGQPVTFTATVTPSTSGVPTGTVVFSVDGSPSVSATLNSTGSATFTTSSLSVGTHEITCNYSGDGNFQPSNSFLIQIVGTNAPTFSLVSFGGTFSVTAGQSVPIGIAVKSVPSFKSTIMFSCSGLPTGATCSFGPAQITPTGYISYTTLTITTTGSQSSGRRFYATPSIERTAMQLGILGLSLAVLWLVARGQSGAPTIDSLWRASSLFCSAPPSDVVKEVAAVSRLLARRRQAARTR